jgi:hypothetical protein
MSGMPQAVYGSSMKQSTEMRSLTCLLKKVTKLCHVVVQQSQNHFRNVLVSILGGGVAQRYSAGLPAGWPGVRVPAGVGNFSLQHRVQTGSEAHPAPYPMGSRDSIPGDKSAGAWSWLLTSIECRVQECVELYLHSQYAFMAWCLVWKVRGLRLYFYLISKFFSLSRTKKARFKAF